ncbi:MAG: sodium:solute symporter, partial [Pseudomonadota bacterium]
LAAALCTISATGFAIATMLSEDVVFGSQWEPPTRLIRLLIGRLTVVGVLVLAALTSAVSRTDPLQMMLWAMAITGSTAFPLMVLTVWYKRLTPTAAAMLLIVGFVTAIVMIPATLFLVPNVPIVGIAPIGFVAALTAGLVTTRLTGRPVRGALEHVRDMRVPGGETIIDRENRLMRLKESR